MRSLDNSFNSNRKFVDSYKSVADFIAGEYPKLIDQYNAEDIKILINYINHFGKESSEQFKEIIRTSLYRDMNDLWNMPMEEKAILLQYIYTQSIWQTDIASAISWARACIHNWIPWYEGVKIIEDFYKLQLSKYSELERTKAKVDCPFMKRIAAITEATIEKEFSNKK